MTNLTEFLFDKNKNNASKIAFVDNTKTITYYELEQSTRLAATWMVDQQIGHGDRVVIALYDNIETVVCFLATMLIGATAVMVNPRTKRDKLNYQINYVSPKIILAESTLIESQAIDTSIPIFSADHMMVQSSCLNEYSLLSTTKPTDVAYMVWTSGTTGHAKAVMHCHSRMISSAERNIFNLLAEDKNYPTIKLFFAYGIFMLVATLAVGAESYLDSEIFNPAKVRRILTTYNPTKFYSVPVIYRELIVEDSAINLPAKCYSAGDKLPDVLRSKWHRYSQQQIYNCMGSSELNCFFINYAGTNSSLGTVVDGYDARIVDHNYCVVPHGQIGTLQVKSNNCAVGYFNDEKWSKKTFKEWISTGDLCYQDDSGYFWYLGRDSEIIKINGQYISPNELEESLLNFQGVQQAAVLSKSGKDDIDTIEAFVVPIKDVTLNLIKLKQWMFSKHEKHSCPKIIHIMDDLPRTDTGKLERYKLKNII